MILTKKNRVLGLGFYFSGHNNQKNCRYHCNDSNDDNSDSFGNDNDGKDEIFNNDRSTDNGIISIETQMTKMTKIIIIITIILLK